MTAQLPCDGDGICMFCKSTPPEVETLECKTCITPWHVNCLSKPPESLSSTLQWDCPDCSNVLIHNPNFSAGASSSSTNSSLNQLVSVICAIESDTTLTDQQKAKKRQELISGIKVSDPCENEDEKNKKKMKKKESDVKDILHDKLMCLICMQLPHKPVTTPCGHNFCLKCFEKWVNQQPRKQNCPECRSKIPDSMVNQPRINAALVTAIRMAKGGENSGSGSHRHLGRIPVEKDPMNQGIVMVGEYGAKSVALSGDYEDNDNHGDWFLYTGSGGRDLDGNNQSYEKSNEALRVSFLRGYPVRVVRSHKEKRSSYAPLNGLRCGVYRIEKCWRKIGIQGHKVCRYLFVRCDNEPAPWSSDGRGDLPRPLPVIKELKRATNITDRKDSPSWDYDEEDCCWKWKKPPPNTAAAASCTTITESERGNNLQTTVEIAVCKVNMSSWDVISIEDYNPDKDFMVLENQDDDNSNKPVQTETFEDLERAQKKAQNKSDRNQLLNALKCQLCREVMNSPLTTPCAHNFCKPCLESVFAGKSSVRKRYFCQGRSLRAQKSIMKCPSCPMDLSEFLQNPQVNRELMAVIEDLQRQAEEENDEDASEETGVFNKPVNMIGVAKDGSDNSDMLDDILEIEGEPKQMNKRLKTKGSVLSANAEKSEFKSNESLEEMKLDVAEDLQFQAGKENDEDPSEEIEGFDKPENMIGVAKDGSDNSDMLDDVLKIEGEFKQMNKHMKTKGSDFSGNAEKSECKSIESVDKMKLDVEEDIQFQAGKENDEDPSEEIEGFDMPKNMIEVAKDGTDNSDMLDDVLEIEGEFKQMNKRLKTKGSDFSGNAEKSECKKIESVDKMKLDVADEGNVVTKDAVKEVVKTSRTFTAKPKPKRGSGGDCLPKPEPSKRGRQKKTKETAVAVVADEVLKMVRRKEMTGGGDNSTTTGTSSNHLAVSRSLVKRSTDVNKMKTLHATPALIVPDSFSTSTTSVTAAAEGVAIEKKSENKCHGVGKEQEATDQHIEERDHYNDEHEPGFIFLCNAKTKPEIFKYSVFGLPLGKIYVVENINPGAMLFLFDVNLKLLYGVYKATSRGERDLEPAAFGGRFPAQVRFNIFRECLPLPESVFKHAIKENYHGGTKFQQKLSNCQAKKLFALFHPIGCPTVSVLGAPPRQSPPIEVYQNRQPSRLPPPNDPYASPAFHRGHGTPPPPMSGYIHSAAQKHWTNPYFGMEGRRTYSRENALIPAHNPYTRHRAAPDVESQGAKVGENEYNPQLLPVERKREQEKQLTQQFGGASYYSTHPSHAAATTYAIEPSHGLPETQNSGSSYIPLQYPPRLVNDASFRALPPPHHTPHSSLYDASVHALPPLHRTPPPLSYDPLCQAYVPATSHSSAYWAAVAREDPNRVYI
ncbi:uncharacterized protein LOC113308475 [Papaver somniferum]|uniref:uncharacterized protein LOC113308475 n=1 Tax=Papaver somniferum TaxID=3469 RepID=UPI000E703B91|nr:uncharacterized protein LOC113308475 [Papaver somniferum]